jgi:hypothetical protein
MAFSVQTMIDHANYKTIIDIACANVAFKAVHNAEFPLRITITRDVGLPPEQIVQLHQACVGRLKENLVLDFDKSKFDKHETKITYWVSNPYYDSDGFTANEKLFLKTAAFWLERCYDIALYQEYIKKTDNVFIAGGALNRYYHRALRAQEPWLGAIGDVDFWFMEESACAKFREKWGTGNLVKEENNIETYRGEKGVYTTTKGMDPLYDMKFQFIHFSAFDPEELDKVFDFKHCLPFWASDDKTLYVQPEHFGYIKEKLLAPCDKEVPILEARLRKYQEQGFQKIKLPRVFAPPGKWEDKTETIEWYIENILEKQVDTNPRKNYSGMKNE